MALLEQFQDWMVENADKDHDDDSMDFTEDDLLLHHQNTQVLLDTPAGQIADDIHEAHENEECTASYFTNMSPDSSAEQKQEPISSENHQHYHQDDNLSSLSSSSSSFASVDDDDDDILERGSVYPKISTPAYKLSSATTSLKTCPDIVVETDRVCDDYVLDRVTNFRITLIPLSESEGQLERPFALDMGGNDALVLGRSSSSSSKNSDGEGSDGGPTLPGGEQFPPVCLFRCGVVSKVHATVVVQDGAMYIQDENSTHGTFLNGERVLNKVLLNDGDTLVLGRHVTRKKEAFFPLRLHIQIHTWEMERETEAEGAEEEDHQLRDLDILHQDDQSLDNASGDQSNDTENSAMNNDDDDDVIAPQTMTVDTISSIVEQEKTITSKRKANNNSDHDLDPVSNRSLKRRATLVAVGVVGVAVGSLSTVLVLANM
ncbi:hypothetical protein BG004_005472 [Podila humilis]|nr:hypothetical protein BG004_005472 [Podila humilis]